MTAKQRDYINSVRNAFPTINSKEQAYFSEFKGLVRSYIRSNKLRSVDGLIEHFGTPEDVVERFYNTPDSELPKYSKKSSKNVLFTTIAIIITLAIIAGAILLYINTGSDSEPAYVDLPSVVVYD